MGRAYAWVVGGGAYRKNFLSMLWEYGVGGGQGEGNAFVGEKVGMGPKKTPTGSEALGRTGISMTSLMGLVFGRVWKDEFFTKGLCKIFLLGPLIFSRLSLPNRRNTRLGGCSPAAIVVIACADPGDGN